METERNIFITISSSEISSWNFGFQKETKKHTENERMTMNERERGQTKRVGRVVIPIAKQKKMVVRTVRRKHTTRTQSTVTQPSPAVPIWRKETLFRNNTETCICVYAVYGMCVSVDVCMLAYTFVCVSVLCCYYFSSSFSLGKDCVRLDSCVCVCM